MEKTLEADNLLDNNPVDNADVTVNKGDADDFFASLDKEVNSLAYDDGDDNSFPQQEAEQRSQPQVETTEQRAVVGNDELSTIQKRYADSSREAKRLNQRVNELEQFSPLLDAFRRDPNLVSHVKNYFEGGGQPPKTIKENLGLEEDFVFDAEDAVSSPDSDSAKLFGATVDGIVNRRIKQMTDKQAQKQTQVNELRSFQDKFPNVTEGEYTDLIEYAKNTPLKLEDIYYLKNRGQRDANIANSAKEDVRAQMNNVRQRPASLASKGESVDTGKGQDDMVFDKILGIDSKLENAFG